MSNNSISADQVFALCRSESQFPIKFDDAWVWIGYGRKNNAKRALLSFGFIEGIDLLIEEQSMESKFGTPEQYITMSVDCFKMWAMMAATEKGRETRIYFLQCERKMKQLAANPVRTDWVVADLMENDVLSGAMMGASQIFLSLAKEEEEQKNSLAAAKYKELAHFVCIAAHIVQTQSPEILDEEAEWTPAVERDNQNFCLKVRDAMVLIDPRQALKELLRAVENDRNSMFLRGFPTSVAIPGYQRGDQEISSQEVAALSIQKQKAMLQDHKKMLQTLKKAASKK